MEKRKSVLLHLAIFVVSTYFLFAGLVYAKPFLAPLLTAVVLALLLLPVTQKLEILGVNRVLATSASTLVLLAVTAGFVVIIFYQLKGFSENWEVIQSRMTAEMQSLSEYLEERTPLDQDQISGFGLGIGEGSSERSDGRPALGFVMNLFGYLTNGLLIVVYVFLFIHFRGKFKAFILRFFPENKREEIATIVSKSSAVSRRYLAGKLLLMIFLAILYFVGLFASGLENALLISLIAALLSIIPIIGNLFGYFIAIAVSLVSDGGIGMLVGITLTFALAQIIDTYILQPIVLGDKVDVHPVFIIMSVVVGYLVWGIIGLVLAIPLFGMITVVCRYVPALSPYGFLFSKNDKDRVTPFFTFNE